MCDNRAMPDHATTPPGDIPALDGSDVAAAALSRARIAYTDIDGTLLGRGGCLLCDTDGRPSLAAAQAVVSVNEAGLPVVAVSGRTVPMLKEITRMLGWRDFVAEMGAIRSYDRESEIVYDLGAWPDGVAEKRTPYRIIEDAGAISALRDAFPGKLEYHTPHHRGREATHLLRGGVDAGAAQAVLDSLPDAADVPIAILDNGVIHPPRTTLDDVERVHAYHVTPAGTSKTAGILADLGHRGLEPEQAVMIGDSPADLDVCDAVGLVVLVGNALRSEDVLERAPRLPNVVVTPGFSGEGWAEFAAAWIRARR